MLIVGDPGRAFALAAIPNAGVGLARTEFIVTNHIGIHPMALARYPQLARRGGRSRRSRRRIGDEDAATFFVRRFSEGVGAHRGGLLSEAGHRPDERLQDERVRRLLGGREFEPTEENPMLGFRGRLALLRPALRGRLRARVRGAPAGARRDWG